MESLRQWLQDWSDACEYAKECAPDLSFFSPGEPYTALLGIGLICFGVWWRNERAIPRSQIAKDRAQEAAEPPAATPEKKLEELREIIEQAKAGKGAKEKAVA